MKRLAAVGVAGVDPAMSGPVVHTDAGAAPVGKVVEKRGGGAIAVLVGPRAPPALLIPGNRDSNTVRSAH
jgi:hypothetical protein